MMHVREPKDVAPCEEAKVVVRDIFYFAAHMCREGKDVRARNHKLSVRDRNSAKLGG